MAYELFCDSFDTYQFSANNSAYTNVGRWSVRAQITSYYGTFIATSQGTGRRGSASLRLYSENNAWVQALTSGFSQSTHIVVGFSRSVYQGAGTFSIRFKNSTSVVCGVTVGITGQVSATLGGVTYTSVNSVGAGSFIEVGVVVGNTGALQVRVDGASGGWLDLTNVDTQAGSATTASSIELEWFSGAGGVDIDDFYITYGNELKWLGDIRVDAIPINANATPQDWTPDEGEAYQRLTQSAGYIQSATVGAESLFELADYAVNTVAIHGVVVSARALKSDSGTRSFAIEARSGNTTSVGATNALGTSSQEFRQTWLTDPNTGAAWTGAALNALKAGVKLVE